jgi:hypothetical protein
MATRVNKREYAYPAQGVRVVELQCGCCKKFHAEEKVTVSEVWASDMMLSVAVCNDCEAHPAAPKYRGGTA